MKKELTFREHLKIAVDALGGYEATGRACGITGKAVFKWQYIGHLPRTDYTGETSYAEKIEDATRGAIKVADLRLPPERWG